MSSKPFFLQIILRQIIAFLLSLILVYNLTGCNGRSQNEENANVTDESSVSDVTSNQDRDQNQGILLQTLFMRYHLFVPADFRQIYNNGDLYQKGIDLWGELQYEQAEKCLLIIKDEIETSGAVYSQDIAYVKEAIGCLYIDMAKYDEAYDYLIDALVTMRRLYGNKALETNSVSIALCHYYYSVGDYEWCLKEIQNVRANNSKDYVQCDRWDYIRLFIDIVLNDLEADIYMNQYNLNEAYTLYMENLTLCNESIRTEEDDTFSAAMKIDVLIALGNFYTECKNDPKYCELADICYDKALSLCEYYIGDYKEEKKAEILMKKGYFHDNYIDIEQAMEIQKHLFGTKGTYPGLVESYRYYAEYLGFIIKDENGADEYYQKALSLCDQTYKHNHPETAKIYESMGRYYGNRRGDVDKAAKYFKNGIEIHKNLITENNPLVASMYLQLAGCCRLLGDEDSCQEYLEKNKEIEMKLGFSHINLDDMK